MDLSTFTFKATQDIVSTKLITDNDMALIDTKLIKESEYYGVNISRPKTTRWNRKYTEVAEFYYKWEIEVMMHIEKEYDFKFLMNDVPIPAL